MTKWKEFLWLCAGADRNLLQKTPTESSKYAGIGATILFTGILAAISGGYAVYFVFENVFVAIAFGLVWGAMIFNLDRYIVSSMRKRGSLKHEFIMAAPRIILAVLIAVVISKPLELRIFEKEINTELELMTVERIKQNEALIRSRFEGEQASRQSHIRQLKAEIEAKEAKRDELRRAAQMEADGTGGTLQRNAGPIYRIKKADADRVERELEALRAENSDLIGTQVLGLARLDSTISAEMAALSKDRMDGMAGRLEALQRLTAKSTAIWLANWFIILLFIAIETAPVFVKIISEKGPYDHLLEAREHGYFATSKSDIGSINLKIKKQASDFPQLEKDFVEDELELALRQYKG